MMRNEGGGVVVRLPEKYASETRARYQSRLRDWRARKGWQEQIAAQQPVVWDQGEQADKGAA